VLEHLAQVRAQRDPHLLEGLRGTLVGDLLGALAAHSHERALDGADHAREVQLARRLSQPVAAFGAPLRANDARGAQLREDVLQKGDGDSLRLSDLIDLARGLLA
jgi:hypothetical protein